MVCYTYKGLGTNYGNKSNKAAVCGRKVSDMLNLENQSLTFESFLITNRKKKENDNI